MKRIDYIVKKSKGVLKDNYTFRENKIKRTLEDAIDYAEEQVIDSNRKAVEVINSIKDIADDRESIKRKLNEYITEKENAEGYKRTAQYLNEVKDLLNEEVEVEEEDDEK